VQNTTLNKSEPVTVNDRLPRKVYIWGAVMILLGLVNVFYLIFKPEFDPFLILFFYSIPANTAISVFPHEPIVILYGKDFNLLLIAFISTLSTVTAAYIDHTVFTPLLNYPKFSGYKDSKIYQRAIYYFGKFPFCTIVVAALTPIPFWPVKMLAFSKKYPMILYLAAVMAGRFPRYYLLAKFGEITMIPDWVIWSVFAVIFVSAGIKLAKKKR
jgi:ribonucleoside-triphosphate reductase